MTDHTTLRYPSIQWDARLSHYSDAAVHAALAQAWQLRHPDDADAVTAADKARQTRADLLQQLVDATGIDGISTPTSAEIVASVADSIWTRLAVHVAQNTPPSVTGTNTGSDTVST